MSVAPPAAPRILLVDDHADTTELYRMILERRGMHVVVAGSMSAALEAAGAGAFDVLVSDIGLPDGSGLDLLAELRRRGPIAAIAMTGLGGEDDARRCREAGFDEHFTKPASSSALVEAVRRLSSR